MKVHVTFQRWFTRVIILGYCSLATLSVGCKEQMTSIAIRPADTYCPDILHEFLDRYPEPISVSPDASKILFRVLNAKGDPFGFSVFDIKKNRTVATVSFADDPMRIVWRPDSKSLSFFTQSRQKNGRALHLWMVETGIDYILSTPRAEAESSMKWSPDLRYFAYMERDLGLVIVDSSQKSAAQVIKATGYIFDWLPDSHKLVMVPSDRQNTLEIVTVDGRRERIITLPSDNQLLDAVYSAKRNELIVINRTPADPFLVERIAFDPLKVFRVFRSVNELDSPRLLPNGAGCLVEVIHDGARSIQLVSLSNHDVNSIGSSRGDNEVGAIDKDSRFVVVMRRSENPLSIEKCDIRSGHKATLYAKSTSAHYPAEERWIKSSNNLQIPLYIWRAKHGTEERAAIIRLHGFNVKETPTWQDEVQIAVSHGVDYISCNYRGSLGFGYDFEKAGSIENQMNDVQATMMYVHNELGIPFKKIAIIGYSSGADIAVATASEKVPHPGVIALVGYSGRLVHGSAWNKQSHPRVLMFHGKYEEVSLKSIISSASNFASRSGDKGSVEIYELNDNHDFNYPGSRAAIYTAVLDAVAKPR